MCGPDFMAIHPVVVKYFSPNHKCEPVEGQGLIKDIMINHLRINASTHLEPIHMADVEKPH